METFKKILWWIGVVPALVSFWLAIAPTIGYVIYNLDEWSRIKETISIDAVEDHTIKMYALWEDYIERMKEN